MAGASFVQRINTTQVGNVFMPVTTTLSPQTSSLQVGMQDGSLAQVSVASNMPLSVFQATAPAALLGSIDADAFSAEATKSGLAGKTVLGLKLNTTQEGLAAFSALTPDQAGVIKTATGKEVAEIVANPQAVADMQLLAEIVEEDKGGVPSLKLGEL